MRSRWGVEIARPDIARPDNAAPNLYICAGAALRTDVCNDEL